MVDRDASVAPVLLSPFRPGNFVPSPRWSSSPAAWHSAPSSASPTPPAERTPGWLCSWHPPPPRATGSARRAFARSPLCRNSPGRLASR